MSLTVTVERKLLGVLPVEKVPALPQPLGSLPILTSEPTAFEAKV